MSDIIQYDISWYIDFRKQYLYPKEKALQYTIRKKFPIGYDFCIKMPINYHYQYILPDFDSDPTYKSLSYIHIDIGHNCIYIGFHYSSLINIEYLYKLAKQNSNYV